MTEDSENNGATSAPDFHTDMPVGEILRRTRTHYGLNLQQVEQILRIRASNLEALETGDVSQLPGRVYAIGFVRAYAEYLGLDGDKMVHLFKQQSVGDKKKIDLSDTIFVVNKNGYIGSAVKNEIEYAKIKGKEILFLEELNNY